MDRQENDLEALTLDQEFLLEQEEGGEASIPKDPDVLILDDEAEPLPVLKTVEVRARQSGQKLPDVEFGIKPARTSISAWDVSIARQASKPKQDGEGSEVHTAAAVARYSSDLSRLLSEARVFASLFSASEARTRASLYAALGCAYDFAELVKEHPEEYARLLEQAGLTVQERAPTTPLVRLVFGTDYDKRRVTEFAAVIDYGQRLEIPVGEFGEFLVSAQGGIKGVVQLERQIRGEKRGSLPARISPRLRLTRQLRAIPEQAWDSLSSEGDEFTLVMARRMPDGTIAPLGELPRDVAFLERAARKLLSTRK